jgi:hypothetical protein
VVLWLSLVRPLVLLLMVSAMVSSGYYPCEAISLMLARTMYPGRQAVGTGPKYNIMLLPVSKRVGVGVLMKELTWS